MPLISQPQEVEAIYQEARECGVCLADFCVAHPYAVEATLRASLEFSREHNISDIPVIISVTGNYPIESQLISYTSLHDPLFGLRAFLSDIDILISEGSPYADLRVMLHLDHAQPDGDIDLLPRILDRFATVMYDASSQPLAENIRRTSAFVERNHHRVQIEGAVTEIVQAKSQAQRDQLTTPEEAEYFWRATGVSLLVCNLGSEHRATVPIAHYNGDVARAIKERVGQRLVLHGGSSVPDGTLSTLVQDGIIKINLWTTFERAGGQAAARDALMQLGNILSADEMARLRTEGWLGARFFSDEYRRDVCFGSLGPKSSVLLEERHRDVWQEAVVARTKFYLGALGYSNFGRRQ
jgi:fructose/tagatose bisphosphate aldolase